MSHGWCIRFWREKGEEPEDLEETEDSEEKGDSEETENSEDLEETDDSEETENSEETESSVCSKSSGNYPFTPQNVIHHLWVKGEVHEVQNIQSPSWHHNWVWLYFYKIHFSIILLLKF